MYCKGTAKANSSNAKHDKAVRARCPDALLEPQPLLHQTASRYLNAVRDLTHATRERATADRGGVAHFRAAFEQNRSGHKSVAAASDVAHMHEYNRDIEQAGESQRHAVEERQLAGPTSEAPVKENGPLIANKRTRRDQKQNPPQ
jgi:hypothetical protein